MEEINDLHLLKCVFFETCWFQRDFVTTGNTLFFFSPGVVFDGPTRREPREYQSPSLIFEPGAEVISSIHDRSPRRSHILNYGTELEHIFLCTPDVGQVWLCFPDPFSQEWVHVSWLS